MVSGSGGSGILLVNAHDSQISENTVTGSIRHGIGLIFSSTDNEITENTSTGNGDGFAYFDLFHDESSTPNEWDENIYVTKSGADIP